MLALLVEICQILACIAVMAASAVVIWKANALPPQAAPPVAETPQAAPPVVESIKCSNDLFPVHAQGFVTGYFCHAMVVDPVNGRLIPCQNRHWTMAYPDLVRDVLAGTAKPACKEHMHAVASAFTGCRIVVVDA